VIRGFPIEFSIETKHLGWFQTKNLFGILK
jgi:hypothetical protein